MRFERYSPRCASFMAAYYIGQAVFQSFISLYYKAQGFTDGQIGYLSAALALVSLLSMRLWGPLGDRVPVRNHLLLGLCLGASASILLFFGAKTFAALLAFVCLYSVFYTSIQPLGDSIILETLEEERKPFGPIRMTGTLCFAFTSFFAGRLFGGAGQEDRIIYLTSVMMLATGATSFILPRVEGHQYAGGKNLPMRTLYRHKNLMKLFAMMLPLQIAMGYFYAFFSPFFATSLPGGNTTLLGICYFMSALSEVPFLSFGDRLFRRFGAGRLMCVSAAALAVRFTILGFTKSVPLAMASQLCHGGGFIVITFVLSKYINRTCPDELKASGQLLLSIFGFGLARVVGYCAGGILADRVGYANVFKLTGALCALTFIVFAPGFLRRPPLNGEGERFTVKGE